MIKKVLHKNIDRKKYTECLKNSKNYRIYAEDWYLDAVSEKKWDCYVYGDYDAVMPVPYKRKFGVKFILQPILCQQLGVFSKIEISEEIFLKLIKRLHRNLILNYNFNEENGRFLQNNHQSRNNFILPLNRPFDDLLSNFRRDRLKDIRRIENLDFEINKDFDPELFRADLALKYPYLQKYYSKENFINLLVSLKEKNRYSFYEMKSDNVTIASLFICHSRERRIVLLSTRDTSKNFKGAFAYLISLFIKENANSQLVLDFEGSMMESIADFNKSFGSVKKEYFAIHQLSAWQK